MAALLRNSGLNIDGLLKNLLASKHRRALKKVGRGLGG
jgi:hypothetical protein